MLRNLSTGTEASATGESLNSGGDVAVHPAARHSPQGFQDENTSPYIIQFQAFLRVENDRVVYMVQHSGVTTFRARHVKPGAWHKSSTSDLYEYLHVSTSTNFEYGSGTCQNG